jgi:hypothetical protein
VSGFEESRSRSSRRSATLLRGGQRVNDWRGRCRGAGDSMYIFRPYCFAHSRPSALGACIIAASCLASSLAYAGATSFVEPAGWTVGDIDSTFQEWEADPSSPFASTDSMPSDSSALPALLNQSTMGVNSPGFPASSGGYYSFGGDYRIFADILNHGGSSGTTGSYPANAGTRVFVQSAATVNTDANVGIYIDSVRLVAPDGSAIPGGCNSCSVRVEELAMGPVETTFGIVPQQEMLYEFYIPEYASDFRVEIQVGIHSSFQHLRVDSRIELPQPVDPDFDHDGLVDGADFLMWQRSPVTYAEADGLVQWKQDYGTSASVAGASVVPEPSALSLLGFAIAGIIIRSLTRCEINEQ